jgi:hypothetical protein
MKSERMLSRAAAGLFLISIAACTSTVQGSGSPVSGAAVTTSSATPGPQSPSPAVGSSAPATSTTAESGPQPPARHTTVTTSPNPNPNPNPSRSKLPPPSGPTLGASLDYTPACPPDAAAQQNATAEVTLNWSVTNATGIKVGIDNANIADGTSFSGKSGQQDLTLLHCNQPYTFDIWTTGGSGQTAHRHLVYNLAK